VRRAVLLDRDGTLIEEAGYLDRLERLAFFPYSVDAVRLLNQAGFVVVVVTNQSGVARGIVEEAFVQTAHEYITARLVAGGARVDGFYYCPHHPSAVREDYRRACDCRKPAPGLLRRAAKDLDIDLSRSFVVGDRWHDLDAGTAVGAQGVLVRTGYGRITETSPPSGAAPAAVVDNLIEAVTWILRQP
jgi:D-glycero-D-manno-heptose 1,7-bisphosphate phosphatase